MAVSHDYERNPQKSVAVFLDCELVRSQSNIARLWA